MKKGKERERKTKGGNKRDKKTKGSKEKRQIEKHKERTETKRLKEGKRQKD